MAGTRPVLGGDRTCRIALDAIIDFVMPVFFLVSGLFSALLWQSRGLRPGDTAAQARRGPFPGSLRDHNSAHGPGLGADLRAPGAIRLPVWVLPLFSLWVLMHLWFLWCLLLFVALFILLARLGAQFRNPAVWWVVIPVWAALSLVMRDPLSAARSMGHGRGERKPTPPAAQQQKASA